VDNLPKTQTDDFPAFTGIYPNQTTGGNEPPVSGGGDTSNNQPKPIGVTSAPPPPPFTSTATQGESKLNPPPSTVVPPPEPNPAPTSPPLMSTVAEPFGQTAAPVETVPPTPVVSPLAPEPSPKAPKTAFNLDEKPPPPPKKSGPRRWLLTLVFLVVLVVLGFVAFKVVGQFLTGSKPVTLTYWGLWEEEAFLKPAIDEYKKTHPQVEIVYTKQSPKQYRERLQAAITRGEGPDIFRFHNTWVPMLKDDLAPAGKTGYQASEIEQTFYPVVKDDLVIGGKVYGAPMMFDGLGLYYNEDLLKAASITPPTSWDDLRKAALALTVKDNTGQIITAGAALGTANNIEHFSDILGVMLLQNGADLKNPITKEAVDALAFYRLFAEKPNEVWNNTLDNSILAFANGRVAFIFAPSWQALTIKQLNPNLKFQIVPIPQLPGTNITWAAYWVEGVSAKSKYQDEAWEFLKYLTSKQTLTTIYTETTKAKERPFGEPYARVDLAQTLINDPYAGAYIRQAPTAKSFFLASRTYDNGLNDRMIKYLEDAVNSLDKGVANQAALETAASGFTQVLNSFGGTASGK